MRRAASGALAALALASFAPGIAAQQERHASVVLDGAGGITAIRANATASGGGSALVDLGLRVRFGGAGWVLFDTPTVPPGYALHMAYGGVLAEADLLEGKRGAVVFRTFLGVGNAKVTVPDATVLLGADNFGVLEPEAMGVLSLRSRLGVTLGVSYRATFGVERLPGLRPEELRGATLRLGIRLRGS
jgi:hypothetical protein